MLKRSVSSYMQFEPNDGRIGADDVMLHIDRYYSLNVFTQDHHIGETTPLVSVRG